VPEALLVDYPDLLERRAGRGRRFLGDRLGVVSRRVESGAIKRREEKN
jgi:hypothetical protein